VSEKLLFFLSLRYQVEIRTASFMRHFMVTENSISNLFALQAAGILTYLIVFNINIFNINSVDSINSLKDAILRQFSAIGVLFLVFIVFFY